MGTPVISKDINQDNQSASSMQELQQALSTLATVAGQAASPFVKNAASQQKAGVITAEVQLGIAALPLFATIFHSIGELFHHTHTAVTGATTVVSQPATGTNPNIALR